MTSRMSGTIGIETDPILSLRPLCQNAKGAFYGAYHAAQKGGTIAVQHIHHIKKERVMSSAQLLYKMGFCVLYEWEL